MTIVFNQEIIHSSQKVIEFLNADDEVLEITEHPQTEPPGLLANCWTVTWLAVLTPLMIILVVFLNCIEALLRCFYLKSLATHFDVLARQLMCRVVYLGALICNGSDLIAPLFNTYAFSASDVYLQDPAPSPPEDPVMAKAAKGQNEISFHRGGICKGGTIWFLKLNFLTEHAIPDFETRMRSIASTFYYGAQSRPALLQALNFPEASLLRLVREEKASVQLGLIEETRQEIEKLEPGIYEVFLPFHRLALFKMGAQLGYIVDFNVGVIKREGDKMSRGVASYLNDYSRPSEGAENTATFILNLFSS